MPNQETILPVRETIEFRNQSLFISKRVAAGLTGEVFEGRLISGQDQMPVAVKAMRSVAYGTSADLFREEGQTLGALNDLESSIKQGELRVAPIYYGQGEYDGIPFLVMEYIQGKPIPELLAESSSGRFAEAQALTAGWHLFRTLDLLHTGDHLRKSYIDLKFENLWWVTGSQQLKLTDFGTMEKIKRGDAGIRQVRRDMLVSSAYLSRMLIGYMPDFFLGELREQVGPVIQRTEGVSWGAKYVLNHFLHRNENQRPASAGEAAKELRQLVEFWQRPVAEVAQIKSNNWDLALESDDDEKVRRLVTARKALDIWARRENLYGSSQVQEEIRQLDELILSVSELENGKVLVSAGSFKDAQKMFERGRNQSQDPDAIATLRRWSYIAQIGLDFPERLTPETSEKLQEVAEGFMGTGAWDLAQDRLEELKSELGRSAGFKLLAADVMLHQSLGVAYDAVRRGDHRQAADAFQKSREILRQFPEKQRAEIERDETGDLLAMYSEAVLRASALERQSEARQLLTQAKEELASGRGDKALESARLAFDAAMLLSNEAIMLAQSETNTMVTSALANGQYDLAVEFSSLSSRAPHTSPSLRNIAAQARLLSQAGHALDVYDTGAFLELVRIAQSLSDSRSVATSLAPLFAAAYTKAKNASDIDFLRALAGLTNDERDAQKWLQEANELEAATRAELHPEVERLLAEAQRYLYLSEIVPIESLQFYAEHPTQRLEKANELAGLAVQLAATAGYRKNEAAQLKRKVDDALKSAREQSVEVARLEAERKAKAEQARREILQLRKDFQSTKARVDSSPEYVTDDRAYQLLLLSNRYLANFNPDDKEVRAIRDELYGNLDFLPPADWQRLRDTAEKRLEEYSSELESAKELFEKGDWNAFFAKFQILQKAYQGSGNVPYEQLETAAERAIRWKSVDGDLRAIVGSVRNYQGANPANAEAELKRLREILPYQLPIPYWHNSQIPASLDWLNEQARLWTSANLHLANSASKSENARFLVGLSQWFDVATTRRLCMASVEQANGAESLSVVTKSTAPASNAPPWSLDTFINATSRAAMQGDIQALQAAIENGALPLDVDAALNSIKNASWDEMAIRTDDPRTWQDSTQAEGEQRRPPWWRYAIAAATAIVVIGLIAGGLYYFRDELQGFLGSPILASASPTSSATQVPSSQAEQPAEVLAAVTDTPTPTIAPTNTLVPTSTPTTEPTATHTPVPTPTDTPPEASSYFVTGVITPALPVTAEAVWQLPLNSADVQPPLDNSIWLTSTENAELGSYRYLDLAPGVPISITWRMDQPLNEGLYQLYVLDTLSLSGGEQLFEVSLDGQLQEEPFLGQSRVIFDLQDLGQEADYWLPIGAYQIQQGQNLSVRAVVDSGRDNPFAAPAILVARLGEQEQLLLEELQALSTFRPFVALLDDQSVEVFVESNDRWVPPSVPEQWVIGMAENAEDEARIWNGEYHIGSINPDRDVALRAEWRPVGRLPAGEYQLLALIPPGSSAIVNYELLVDGEPATRTGTVETPQREFVGEWVDVATWILEEEAAVGVAVTGQMDRNRDAFPDESVWILGVDAVVLLRVDRGGE